MIGCNNIDKNKHLHQYGELTRGCNIGLFIVKTNISDQESTYLKGSQPIEIFVSY